jgi:O-methyltransferase
MKKRYKALVQRDDQISKQLKTKEGRDLYWQSLIDESQNYDLIDLLLNSIVLEGEIIEFGVWRGNMTKRMAAVAKNAGAKKRLYACDSFEGFGDEVITSEDTSLFRPVSKLKKKFTAASDVPDKLDEFFRCFDLEGVCVKGFFNQSLSIIDDTTKYCFAHVDCDAYTSHLDCLNYVYQRMSKSGCIIFDDYDKKPWPGATKAVDEFFSDKPEEIKFSDNKENPAWYIIKA